MIALVLDAELKSALAAVRALGRAGITVLCGSSQSAAMASYSKYCHQHFVYRSPLVDQHGFIEDILRTSPEGEWVIPFAFSDASYLALARNADLLKTRFQFSLPPPASIECAFSKRKTWMLAQQLGIPVPETHNPTSLQELKVIAKQLTYPVVVKPEHTAAWSGGRGSVGRVSFAHAEDELLKRAEQIYLETREMPLIQSYVSGTEWGIEALVERGEVRALCAHKRLRSLSPTGGASVLKTTVPIPDLMSAHAKALLAALKWHGVAMVEFKLDERTQTPLLLEINGRFWGSLPLAVYAGVNFPVLYAKMMEERLGPSDDLVTSTPGVTSRHLLGDVQHLLRVWFKSDPMRSLVYPTRLGALKDFVKTGTVKADVFDPSDPLPSVMEVVGHVVK